MLIMPRQNWLVFTHLVQTMIPLQLICGCWKHDPAGFLSEYAVENVLGEDGDSVCWWNAMFNQHHLLRNPRTFPTVKIFLKKLLFLLGFHMLLCSNGTPATVLKWCECDIQTLKHTAFRNRKFWTCYLHSSAIRQHVPLGCWLHSVDL